MTLRAMPSIRPGERCWNSLSVLSIKQEHREVDHRKAAARGHPKGRTGSITVVQRFGSVLNLNLNFHILCLDGVYIRRAERLRFVRDRPVTTEEVARLVVELATRVGSKCIGVAVGGRDTGGRERLCRYLARPALEYTTSCRL